MPEEQKRDINAEEVELERFWSEQGVDDEYISNDVFSEIEYMWSDASPDGFVIFFMIADCEPLEEEPRTLICKFLGETVEDAKKRLLEIAEFFKS